MLIILLNGIYEVSSMGFLSNFFVAYEVIAGSIWPIWRVSFREKDCQGEETPSLTPFTSSFCHRKFKIFKGE